MVAAHAQPRATRRGSEPAEPDRADLVASFEVVRHRRQRCCDLGGPMAGHPIVPEQDLEVGAANEHRLQDHGVTQVEAV